MHYILKFKVYRFGWEFRSLGFIEQIFGAEFKFYTLWIIVCHIYGWLEFIHYAIEIIDYGDMRLWIRVKSLWIMIWDVSLYNKRLWIFYSLSLPHDNDVLQSFYIPFLHLQFDTVPDAASSPNTVTLKAFTMRMEVRRLSQSHISHETLHTSQQTDWGKAHKCVFTSCYKVILTVSLSQEVSDSKVMENPDGSTESQIGVVTVSTVHMSSQDVTQNPLRRSVSQLMDRKVGEEQDEVWNPHFRAHDSGMVRTWGSNPIQSNLI